MSQCVDVVAKVHCLEHRRLSANFPEDWPNFGNLLFEEPVFKIWRSEDSIILSIFTPDSLRQHILNLKIQIIVSC